MIWIGLTMITAWILNGWICFRLGVRIGELRGRIKDIRESSCETHLKQRINPPTTRHEHD
jgi:hypothetical protein